MNTFLTVLERQKIEKDSLKRGRLTTLQVNMGDLCNQSCAHCHIGASPQGGHIMPRKVVDEILDFLRKNKIKTLDITGGAPELNPDFDYMVSSARLLVDELIVRSNLTVLFEKGKDYLFGFFKTNEVHLICSLPCYTKENVNRQRGAGVFEKSLRALMLLNEKGFSRQKDLRLDLVYNSLGAYLPAPQEELEREYKKSLKDNFGIEFNRLLTITNVPIRKFRDYLESNNEYEKYSSTLENNFNPKTIQGLMCRSFLSVGYDGKIYDCDFNLALGYGIKDDRGEYLSIGRLIPPELEGRQIITGEHCLACTAGSGSSCQGALSDEAACSAQAGKNIKEAVRGYYGKVLKGKKDLKTGACCAVTAFPEPVKSIIKKIEPEILDKFYGCGSPIPPLLEGCHVLDLGSGTGRDVYILSALVGEDGLAAGIDMTDEQLAIAVKYKDSQMERFGFKRCNVDFKKGYIENLKGSGIKDNSQDLVVSNCVINLSPDKESVFSEIFRVLKPGGELYFSDVFADRRIPGEIKADPVLYGECLGGALYIEDFRRMLRRLGCNDYRVMSKRKISIDEPLIADKVGDTGFYSMTIRAFKLADLEDTCEDYGQTACYNGSIPFFPHQFQLDDHHIFISHKPVLVCGNTASMLSNTRFGKHFKITGDKGRHFGLFACRTGAEGPGSHELYAGGSCC